MNIIFKPFAWLMLQLYNLCGNFGAAVILFAIIANIIMLPLHFKGKKSMMKTMRIQPKLQEIQKTYANDRMKQNELIQKVYQDEGINPLGGCGWSLLPFPIFLILYAVMREPLTHLMGLSADQISTVASLVNFEMSSTNGYQQIQLAQLIHENFSMLSSQVPGLIDINFMFFGINLSEVPNWQFWINPSWALIIPVLSGVAAYGQQWVMTKTNPAPNGAAQSNGMLMKLMPLMSVWFCFIMPASMGVYWITNSLISMLRDTLLNKYYGKKFEEEDALRAAEERRKREKEKEERAARIARQQEIAAQQRAALGRPKSKKKKGGQKKTGNALPENTEESESAEGLSEATEPENPSQDSVSDENWKF